MSTLSKVLALVVLLSRWSAASSTCYEESALEACKSQFPTTKEHNGCTAFASGWKKQEANTCHRCGPTSRDFQACDATECAALCVELYPENHSSDRMRCNNGCSAYEELAKPATFGVASCDWGCYLNRYEDLRKAYGANDFEGAQMHYETYGVKEGRDCRCPSIPTNIQLDHIVDYAFLSDKIWTTDNTGYLTDGNTGAQFMVDFELDTDYGRMWLVRTKHRGGQGGECIMVLRQEELHHDVSVPMSLENDYRLAIAIGAIKMIPERIPGTDFYVMKQFNEMGHRFITKHAMVVASWLRTCSARGTPDITLTGHSLGGAVAMWFAYAMEVKDGPNIFGTQDTDVRVGKLVTFDAPPIHFPSSAEKQDICPKRLQDADVAVNFLRGGLTGPVQEDSSFKTFVWSPWNIKSNINGMLYEESAEKFAEMIGRDCVSHIKLERDYLDAIVVLAFEVRDIVSWLAADDETKVYKELLAVSGDYNRRDQFKRYCGERKALADFGCGCGAGYKTNGKCPEKVQFRTSGTCPVFGGLFEGAQESLDMDTKKTIDAPACAEFCTQLEDCKSWYYNKATRHCHALNKEDIGKKKYAKDFRHGLRCPKVREAFMERNVRYIDTTAESIFTMKFDDPSQTQPGEEFCAYACGLHPGCKSWVFWHKTKECTTFKTYMPSRQGAKGFTAGLPQRVTTANLEISETHGECCGDAEKWSGCGVAGQEKCDHGWSYEGWDHCGFLGTKSKCLKTCAYKDWGCGCQDKLGGCTLGLPPQPHENFVRFCEHGSGKGRCCDQTGTPGGRSFDLDVIAGCPRENSLSSIEVVGDCKVQLFTKKNHGGNQYTVIGEGRYKAGSKTFPNDAVSYARVTCN